MQHVSVAVVQQCTAQLRSLQILGTLAYMTVIYGRRAAIVHYAVQYDTTSALQRAV
jgi:hypothetical protein